MNRAVQFAVILVLLLIMIAVFLSPTIDLEPTALRVIFWAVALFASLHLVRIAFSGIREFALGERIQFGPPAIDLPSPSLVDLDCVRLC